jgi:hypothetical protein
MKNYDERVESVFRKYEARLAEQKRRKKLICRTVSIGVGAAAVICIGVYTNALKAPDRPTAESSGLISNTTEAVTSTYEKSVQTSTNTTAATKQTTKTASVTAETTADRSTAASSETVTVKSTSYAVTAVTTAFNTVSTVQTSEKTTAMKTTSHTTNTTAVHTESATTNTTSTVKVPETTTKISTSEVVTTTAFVPNTGTTTTIPHTYTDDTFMYVREFLSNDIYLKSGVNVDESQFSMHLMNTYVTEVATGYEEDVELYELKGVDRKCAVAIKYLSADKCPVYLNTSYEPDTLDDMLRDMAITEQMTFGENNIRSIAEKKYYTVSAEKIMNILNECSHAENTKESLNDIKRDLVIFAKLPYMKYNVSFAISKQGYITTNIIENGASFYIGTEKAEEYINYLLEK